MNFRLISRLLGNVLKIEAVLMLIPLAVSLCYGGSDTMPFVYTIAISLVISGVLSLAKPDEQKFRHKDGFAAAALTWIFLSLFGALPFYFSGYFPSYLDCLFEAISGFTTTGATILINVEVVPRGIIFWRSLTHWIGGMGVLVFMLAVMPSMSASSVNLLKAESPGPAPSKIVPKIRETAKIMYLIYFSMTVALIILLVLAGLPLYDSLIHAFGAAGTGGLSSMNASVGAYNNVPAEVIITIFVLLFGTNFTLYYYLMRKDFKSFFRDEEFRFYVGIVAVSIVVIAIDILHVKGIDGSVGQALRHSSFQVSTIITTTGYSTTDFNLWPALSRTILVLLMLTGCCAGSTGGGIKLIRILALIKAIKNELHKIIHPRVMKGITVNGKVTEDRIIMQVLMFFFLYVAVLIVSTIIVSLDNFDMVTNTTAVIATLSNIGPGLSAVGPAGNYAQFSQLSKAVLSFCMLAGRLEFYPVLVLFTPSIWKKGMVN